MRGKGVRLGLLFGVCAFALVLSGSVVARTNHASANGTMVFAGAADPTYLDPALVSDGESFRVTEQIFEGLVAIRPGTTSIRPALATSWKIARDGKSYVFNLRHNVKFHDGTRFNAKAVCTNFNRWYNFSGPFQDASATYYYQAIFGGFRHNESNTLSPPLYRSCSANGNYRVTIRLTRRNGPLISSDVVGPVCESGDFFAKNRRLPRVGEADYLALMSAGAYGFVMASNYNTRALAAEVLVHGTKYALVRDRQKLPDIWRSEKLPAWLK